MDSQINTNVPLVKPPKAIVQSFLKSQGCMQIVTEFLSINKVLDLQLINKDFYEVIIPTIMTNRKMYPNIDPKMHMFI